MNPTEVEKALAVIQGIAARDAARAIENLDVTRYVEHAPYVADGVAGLRAHIGGLPQENHRLEVVRALQDGPFVVVQAHGEVLGRNEFFDVFRFQDGLIVEHWAFAAPGGPPNPSGHTQVDGPTEPKELENTEKNKAVVRDYYQTVHLSGQHGRIPEYFTGDHCIRHEPGVVDGVAAFAHDLAVLTRNRTIDEIGMLLGQGDFVFLVATGTHEERPCLYVDLYRVEADKLVEHWGFPEEVPSREDRKNDNGML
ncbi:MAG: hypothetical protein JOZ42_04490 [Acetobacteraceae bacterium]|nr:hypothetical protein [Acetobacteraceae bacterium]